jgi:hypothetical protein
LPIPERRFRNGRKQKTFLNSTFFAPACRLAVNNSRPVGEEHNPLRGKRFRSVPPFRNWSFGTRVVASGSGSVSPFRCLWRKEMRHDPRRVANFPQQELIMEVFPLRTETACGLREFGCLASQTFEANFAAVQPEASPIRPSTAGSTCPVRAQWNRSLRRRPRAYPGSMSLSSRIRKGLR